MQELSIRQQYNRDGFYIFKNLFHPIQLEWQRNSIVKLFGGKEGDDLFTTMKAVYNKDIAQYKALATTCSKLYPIHALLNSIEVYTALSIHLEMSEVIIPTGPVVHLMSNDLKIPNGYFGLNPHQDWSSMQGSLDSVVVWAPIVPIDKNLFPLQVIPKSNHKGLLPGDIVNDVFEINTNQYKEDDFIDVEVEPGDVVFMSSFTVHRSSNIGRSNDVRAACSIRYENMKEEHYKKRDYPSCYKRTVDRETITPGFPTLEQVTKLFQK